MLGACLTCPLEVVKTRLQSRALAAPHAGMLSIARAIVLADGVGGLWKGIGPMLVGVVPARAVYFTTYDSAKGILNAYRPEGAATHLLAAVSAGAATNIFINPVWVRFPQLHVRPRGAYPPSVAFSTWHRSHIQFLRPR